MSSSSCAAVQPNNLEEEEKKHDQEKTISAKSAWSGVYEDLTNTSQDKTQQERILVHFNDASLTHVKDVLIPISDSVYHLYKYCDRGQVFLIRGNRETADGMQLVGQVLVDGWMKLCNLTKMIDGRQTLIVMDATVNSQPCLLCNVRCYSPNGVDVVSVDNVINKRLPVHHLCLGQLSLLQQVYGSPLRLLEMWNAGDGNVMVKLECFHRWLVQFGGSSQPELVAMLKLLLRLFDSTTTHDDKRAQALWILQLQLAGGVSWPWNDCLEELARLSSRTQVTSSAQCVYDILCLASKHMPTAFWNQLQTSVLHSLLLVPTSADMGDFHSEKWQNLLDAQTRSQALLNQPLYESVHGLMVDVLQKNQKKHAQDNIHPMSLLAFLDHPMINWDAQVFNPGSLACVAELPMATFERRQSKRPTHCPNCKRPAAAAPSPEEETETTLSLDSRFIPLIMKESKEEKQEEKEHQPQQKSQKRKRHDELVGFLAWYKSHRKCLEREFSTRTFSELNAIADERWKQLDDTEKEKYSLNTEEESASDDDEGPTQGQPSKGKRQKAGTDHVVLFQSETCGHWFCQACWTKYGYRCSELADHAVSGLIEMVSHLRNHTVGSFSSQHCIHDCNFIAYNLLPATQVARLNEQRWKGWNKFRGENGTLLPFRQCAITECEAVAIQAQDDLFVAVCAHGHLTCPSCGGLWHPASAVPCTTLVDRVLDLSPSKTCQQWLDEARKRDDLAEDGDSTISARSREEEKTLANLLKLVLSQQHNEHDQKNINKSPPSAAQIKALQNFKDFPHEYETFSAFCDRVEAVILPFEHMSGLIGYPEYLHFLSVLPSLCYGNTMARDMFDLPQAEERLPIHTLRIIRAFIADGTTFDQILRDGAYWINNKDLDRETWKYMASDNIRPCPGCGFGIYREDGCNHVTCRCKTSFCYDCLSVSVSHRCSGSRKQLIFNHVNWPDYLAACQPINNNMPNSPPLPTLVQLFLQFQRLIWRASVMNRGSFLASQGDVGLLSALLAWADKVNFHERPDTIRQILTFYQHTIPQLGSKIFTRFLAPRAPNLMMHDVKQIRERLSYTLLPVRSSQAPYRGLRFVFLRRRGVDYSLWLLPSKKLLLQNRGVQLSEVDTSNSLARFVYCL
jgi:hypothetical protein